MDLSDNMLLDINAIHLRTWEQSSVIWPGFYKKKIWEYSENMLFLLSKDRGLFLFKDN